MLRLLHAISAPESGPSDAASLLLPLTQLGGPRSGLGAN